MQKYIVNLKGLRNLKKSIFRVLVALFINLPFLVVICFGVTMYSKPTREIKAGKPSVICTENQKETIQTKGTENVQIIPMATATTTNKKQLGEFILTAYCSCQKCCGKWSLNRPKDESGKEIVVGASGKRLIEGYSIAVDPSVIKYGTKVYIDGIEYIAHDCGGAIKGNRIDVYFSDHQEARNFGKKTGFVEVVL